MAGVAGAYPRHQGNRWSNGWPGPPRLHTIDHRTAFVHRRTISRPWRLLCTVAQRSPSPPPCSSRPPCCPPARAGPGPGPRPSSAASGSRPPHSRPRWSPSATPRTGPTAAAAQLIQASPGLERVKLNKMIQTAVLERAAKDAGVTVSPREVGEFRQAQLEKAGSSERLEASALEQAQLAPAQLEADARFKLLRDKLFEHYGSQDKALERLAAAAKELHIKVNPRYGVWDAQQIVLGDQATPWITQRTRPEQAAAGA
ncbi:SurA N-terminal domain-containing protein [Streptomyces sp. CS62]|uniref:SurA N-terminal domain-containing protein n=1 Tax=Streptomyces sp. CS62 TaxID=3119268 RepID=UPI002F959435